MALSITVKNDGFYSELLRDNDLSCRDAYNCEATFEPMLDENGDMLGNSYDMVNMFVKAMELEGYSRVSIAQSLYDISVLMAEQDHFYIKTEEEDSTCFEMAK